MGVFLDALGGVADVLKIGLLSRFTAEVPPVALHPEYRVKGRAPSERPRGGGASSQVPALTRRDRRDHGRAQARQADQYHYRAFAARVRMNRTHERGARHGGARLPEFLYFQREGSCAKHSPTHASMVVIRGHLTEFQLQDMACYLSTYRLLFPVYLGALF